MNKRLILFLAAQSLLLGGADAADLRDMRVEYSSSPLAVSVQRPRFAWQLSFSANDMLGRPQGHDKRGLRQRAYRITVTDESGNEVWNSGKVKSDNSLNIRYAGETLRPAMRYKWILRVWTQENEMLCDSAYFETALAMVPHYNHPSGAQAVKDSQSASVMPLSGARWIGRRDGGVMFYANYFPVFRLSFDVRLDKASRSTAASFIFGANDPRLMDANKNLLGVCNPKDSSYIKLELDAAARAINIYRRGYKRGEDGSQPIATFAIPHSVINESNIYDTHKIHVAVNAGATEIYMDVPHGANASTADDSKKLQTLIGKLNLNPTGQQGGDYIAYPVVGDVGIALRPGQKAAFSNIEVRNFREPQDVITSIGSLLPSGKGLQTVSLKENTAPMLRTVFSTEGKKIAKARLYATAHGIYDMFINGKRVSQDYFNPGSTQYDRTLLYQTFDVTRLMRQGANAMGAILSEGWWSGGSTYLTGNWNFFGDRQSLLAQLVITYEDGTSQVVTTDPATWKSHGDGAVRYASFFMGEVYDARKEQAMQGWATAEYDDSDWQPAAEMTAEGCPASSSQAEGIDAFRLSHDFQLLPDMAEPIRPIFTQKAVSMSEPRKGVYVYDLTQNMAGVPLIRFSGLKPGTVVKIRTAEVKYPDLPRYKGNEGMIMTENLRVAQSQDIYIARGGEETFSPRFTMHGFRYIEITGIDRPLDVQDVQATGISSISQETSRFECSNDDVNRLWLNTIYSARSNFMSIPTDCPQRNERLGWMGDISVFGRSASYITNAAQFLRRYLISVRDTQKESGLFPDVAPTNCGFGGLLWGSAGITVPWELYQQYGDTDMLREHYESMKRYLQFVEDDYIDKKTGIITQHRQWGDLGDWLSPSYDSDDKSLIWECYYIFDLDIMGKMAEALSRQEDITAAERQTLAGDAERYVQLAAQRRDFFMRTYLDPATGKTVFSDFDPQRKGRLIDTQTSYALPLALNVVDGDLRHTLAQHLHDATKDHTLLTGFIGTAWISQALSDNGMSDVAYEMLQHTGYPSWLYPVKNGATTVWERLNSYTVEDGFGSNNSMNSFNHYSFGAVTAWMYSHSLGIRRDEACPGFKHFVLQPEPDPTLGITHAEGHYDSMYGRIESQWQRGKDGVIYEFSVPANTSATLYLPAFSKASITEGGKPLAKCKGIRYVGTAKNGHGGSSYRQDSLHEIELQSGHYHFHVSARR